jgi:ElaB/YqjD/DUF883 family membrane-anchored ribosome-binding protein
MESAAGEKVNKILSAAGEKLNKMSSVAGEKLNQILSAAAKKLNDISYMLEHLQKSLICHLQETCISIM